LKGKPGKGEERNPAPRKREKGKEVFSFQKSKGKKEEDP